MLAPRLWNITHLCRISKYNFSFQNIACCFPSFRISHGSKNEWLRWPGWSRVTPRGDFALTTGGVNGVSQLSVLPLAQVVLLHPNCHLVGLHLRPPIIGRTFDTVKTVLTIDFIFWTDPLSTFRPSVHNVEMKLWMGILHILLWRFLCVL